MGDRTPLGDIIHSCWTNLNIRCANGKYNKYRTINKCKAYEDVDLLFSLEDLKDYCKQNKEHILSLLRPSIDRIDNKKDYAIGNIQFIELSDNIRKDSIKAKEGKCECFVCHTVRDLDLMARDNRRLNGRSTICRECDNKRKRRTESPNE